MANEISIINYGSAKAMMDIFWHLYKLGVEHAHHAQVYEIDDFISRVSSPTQYGLLTDGKVYDWKKWRSHIYFWALSLGNVRLEAMSLLLNSTERIKDVYSSFYPISFCFYMQGIIDRVQTPISDRVFLCFKDMRNVKLSDCAKTSGNPKTKTMNDLHYAGMVQTYAYQLSEQEVEQDISVGQRVGEKRYMAFAKQYWQVMAAHRGALRATIMKNNIKRKKLLSYKRRIGIKPLRDEREDREESESTDNC